MIVTLLVSDIEYDTDGPGIPTMHDLPKSMEVKVDLRDQEGFADINHQVCSQISDASGWLVVAYQLTGYTDQVQHVLAEWNA